MGTLPSSKAGVKGIKQLLEEGVDHIPEFYVLPAHLRPCLLQPALCSSDQPPLIDLAALHGHQRTPLLAALAHACHHWGVFHVINHGVPQPAIDRMFAAVHAFFQLPAVERLRWYSDDPYNVAVAYMPITLQDWDDALVFGNKEGLAEAPEFCREPGAELYKEMENFSARTCKALSESLGLQPERLQQAGVKDFTNWKLHYYSPCPDPSLVLGKGEHTDPDFFTCLLQDQIGGLQVFKEDRWVNIQPRPDSIIVNMGDLMEILTNGRFKSVIHRVVANKERARTSIACFVAPQGGAIINPLPEFINKQNPQLFKDILFAEYGAFFGQDTTGKRALRHYTLQQECE